MHEKMSKIRVLIVDPSEADYGWMRHHLLGAAPQFVLDRRPSLKTALDFLSRNDVDVVVTELSLPDSKAIPTLNRLKAACRQTPIVILTREDNEKLALETIQEGAQDYFYKPELDGRRLGQALKFAIARHEIRWKAGMSGISDSLTGLYNRKGFLLMIEQHTRLANRDAKGFSCCFFVLNNLDEINRVYGKAEGNNALMVVAAVLRECFRGSDVVARIGSDEFAALVWDKAFAKTAATRIRKNRKFYGAQFNQYRLSVSMCVIPYSPTKPETTKEFAVRAEKLLNAHKNKAIAHQLLAVN